MNTDYVNKYETNTAWNILPNQMCIPSTCFSCLTALQQFVKNYHSNKLKFIISRNLKNNLRVWSKQQYSSSDQLRQDKGELTSGQEKLKKEEQKNKAHN